MQMLSNKWLMEETPYWCARPKGLELINSEVWLNVSAPLTESGEFDRCRQFDVDFDPNNLARPAEDSVTKECMHFEYDTSQFQVDYSQP